MRRSGGPVLVVALCLGGCSSDPNEPSTAPPGEPTTSQPTPEGSEPPTASPTTEPRASEPSERPAAPAIFDSGAAMRTVRHLALRVGPREATSDEFAAAADWVELRFDRLGYDVSRQRFRVPAGNSWGVDVPAGTSANVVADPIGFDPSRPHIIVGAHLDTVPQAPGAEDNASGISVMLEVARMAAARPPHVPVRFVAFGAEEPRGEGDALHHFGSVRYVELMTKDERRALVGMVSLDRVGTRGPHVPAWSGPGGHTGVRDGLARSARALGIETQLFDDNASSDHWSFTKAGVPSARLGSIPYTGYHNETDLPRMVDPTQLARVGRTLWHWLRSS